MATYKQNVGTAVVNYAGNYPGAVDGELWYDSTNKDFKYQYPNVTAAGSWATIQSLNTKRDTGAAFGVSTATLFFGGEDPPSTYMTNTELWNGSSWTEVNDLNSGRHQVSGAGVTTSGLCIAGTNPPPLRPPTSSNLVEYWNGTNWAETGDLNTHRRDAAAAGISHTASLSFGGYGQSSRIANTESFNGTNWTEVNDLNTQRSNLAGVGIQTAALAFGGYGPGTLEGETEQWNGTNWTELNDLNTARFQIKSSKNGTYTDALGFGAYTAGPAAHTTGKTELWNGTNWVEQNDLNTSRAVSGGSGTTSAALAISGATPTITNATEEWTGAGAPVGAWATGGSLNLARTGPGGLGASPTASLAFGGEVPPGQYKNETELYNGTSWTELNNLTTGRAYLAGAGTTTAGLAFGGSDPSTGKTETWNGTNWTEVNDLNQARNVLAGNGTSTAALASGGYGPSYQANTETWNGTNWTEVNDLNQGRYGLGVANQSPSTASLVFGGAAPPSPVQKNSTESWNGTNWTEVNNLNQAKANLAGNGTSTAALAFGGNLPGATANTEEWNGAGWTEVANLSVARFDLAGSGTTTSGLAFGGGTPAPAVTAATEEWSSSSNVVKTLTD